MDNPQKLHRFWTQPSPRGNDPESYIEPIHRSEALGRILDGLDDNSSVLEVGCNVGRNLAYLARNGWGNLQGVEINPHAIELLRETYPELDNTPIHLGSAEDVLPRLDPVDIVFTMAVLEHIHPDSTDVFSNIARLSGQHLIAIEPAGQHRSHRQYPHDIPAIFGGLGMILKSTRPMADFDSDIAHYSAYWFTPKPSGESPTT